MLEPEVSFLLIADSIALLVSVRGCLLMMLGHLAPLGPLAAAAERRWRPEWPRWTRALPWVAASFGCIFPDLDILANVLLNGAFTHLYRLPHSAFLYLPLLPIAWLLVRRPRLRLVGLTVLTFLAGVFSHLLLDVVSHGAMLFYPLWDRVVGWTYPPRAGESMLMAYIHSPNILLELGALTVAGGWWLSRIGSGRRPGAGDRDPRRIAIGRFPSPAPQAYESKVSCGRRRGGWRGRSNRR